MKDAATRLEVSVGTIYGLVSSGKLKCHRIGLGRGCIRISDEHIAEFLGQACVVISPPSLPPPVKKPVLKHLRIR